MTNYISLFLTVTIFCSCDRQLHANFDPIELTVETCDNSIIRKLTISRLGDQGTICTIKVWPYKYGKSKINLFNLPENYYAIGLFTELQSNISYEILIHRGHTSAKIQFSTDSIGRIIDVSNLTPCQ